MIEAITTEAAKTGTINTHDIEWVDRVAAINVRTVLATGADNEERRLWYLWLLTDRLEVARTEFQES
jgi:hypothetical protein